MATVDTQLSGPFRTVTHALSDMRNRDLLFVSAHIMKRASGLVIATFSTTIELTDLFIDDTEWLYLVLEK